MTNFEKLKIELIDIPPKNALRILDLLTNMVRETRAEIRGERQSTKKLYGRTPKT